MSRVFADTHFLVAILSQRDADHDRARALFTDGDFSEVVTTAGVMLEFADGMCGVRERRRCAEFIARFRASASTRVVALSESLVERGMKLYADRPDKEWSLTDCISFVVMADEGLTDALTGDHHFEQAGFVALLV